MSDTEITSGDIEAAADAAKPESASPAAHTTTTEIAQPAKPAPVVADEHGPIPFERHEAILGKTRRDYDERISRLSWAEQHQREDVERALKIARLYDSSPDRLASHLSERVNASTEPKPDVKDEHGQLFYSPEQAARWASWQAKKEVAELRAEMDERYGPIASSFSEHQKFERVNAQIDEAQTWPAFADYLPEITAAVTAAKDRGEQITLAVAYIRAGVPQKIADRSTAQLADEKKKWLAELNNTTERVQDDVNPSRVPAASRKKDSDRSIKELLQEEHDRRATA